MTLPPGATIASLMTAGRVTHEWMADQLDLLMTEVFELIAGQRPVTDDLAERLAKCFALPWDWWLDQERR